jgi:uncharacterized membrane protein
MVFPGRAVTLRTKDIVDKESMPDQATGNRAPRWTFQGHELDTSNFITAMIHLYRAEVTRANLWRNRLDTTTNWAVVTTAAALTFSFGSPQNPHFVLLLMLGLVLSFLNTEARRYSYYALWYHRVRMLETEFFAKMLAPPFQPSPDWGEALHDSLMSPSFLISRPEALARRYRRNYVWIVTLLLVSWGIKLMIHPYLAITAHDVIQRAAIGHLISGGWVIGAVITSYAGLTLLTAGIELHYRNHRPVPRLLRVILSPFQRRKLHVNLAVMITNRKEPIAEQLMNELGRGATAIPGKGMFTGDPRDVLLCAITEAQAPRLETIVHELDPDAFVIIAQASDVLGRGFRPLEPPS